jgi:ABC-type amino acid transport substrate-binding protein
MRVGVSVARVYAEPLEALLRKAYGAVGLQVEFVAQPLPRTLVELRGGQVDAASIRAETFFEQNPDIRRVDVPLMTMAVYAIGRAPCPAAISPAELAALRVSYQRGSTLIESLLPAQARVPANTPGDAMLNVANGVADIALLNGTPALADVLLERPLPQVCRVAKPVTSSPLFHALAERHAQWVEPLERALAQMRDRGEIQAAWREFERGVIASRSKLLVQPGRSLTLSPAAPASSAAAKPGQ